jgi:hypothetical protein
VKTLRDYLYWAFEKLAISAIGLLIIFCGFTWWISANEDGPDGFFAIMGVWVFCSTIFVSVAVWVLYRGYRLLKDDGK